MFRKITGRLWGLVSLAFNLFPFGCSELSRNTEKKQKTFLFFLHDPFWFSFSNLASLYNKDKKQLFFGETTIRYV